LEITVPNQFVPRTLRVKDKFFEKSKCVYEVDYIFSKNNDLKKYDVLLYKNGNGTKIPEQVKLLLDDCLKEYIL
jgi:hypothetical protein